MTRHIAHSIIITSCYFKACNTKITEVWETRYVNNVLKSMLKSYYWHFPQIGYTLVFCYFFFFFKALQTQIVCCLDVLNLTYNKLLLNASNVKGSYIIT